MSRDLAIAERIRTASFLARVVGGALGAVLLLSSLFIVSNVVKLTVYARKDEVQLLHVVGATPAYVRGTFVTEGILQGLLGSALALGAALSRLSPHPELPPRRLPAAPREPRHRLPLALEHAPHRRRRDGPRRDRQPGAADPPRRRAGSDSAPAA